MRDKMYHQIRPHGDEIKKLLASSEEKGKLHAQAVKSPAINLNQKQIFDLELLLNGAFSPICSFMVKKDYDSVLSDLCLSDGTFWPIPITLSVPESFFKTYKDHQKIAIRDPEGAILAILELEDIWKPDLHLESHEVYGTLDTAHPGVAALLEQEGSYYIGGKLKGISLPSHYDFKTLRLSPEELRSFFQRAGWHRVIAFQTRKPIHNGHQALTINAVNMHKAFVLLHPIVGYTGPSDIDYFARVRCYKTLHKIYPQGVAQLNLLPYAMRLAGPREALLHAIIHKNYGCTHMIVNPHHADPFITANQKPFYPRFSAWNTCKKYEKECGITMIRGDNMGYLEDHAEYVPYNEGTKDDDLKKLSATELRRRLEFDLEIPSWFVGDGLLTELKKAYPPRNKKGFTIFFTGFSGAGKSTTAKLLQSKFKEMGDRPVTLLDGDIVRKNLSSELGYSKKDRHLNILRIGFVASEITKNGGIAICAPIAPYEMSRRQNKEIISRYGGYIEVYLSTPLSVCMQRDRKGLYTKAKAGIIKRVTGVEDPYEPPEHPDIIIDTTKLTPEEAAQEVLFLLKREGYITGL